MTTFDFITSRDFRRSLESDYAEMRQCVSNEAWKSVHVLAGSIVEALLIDYLVSTPNPGRSPKDPLSCDLAQAVALCKSEGILSQRSADLCSVIRSYRNLIHPGRVVRLGEQAPDGTTSAIAVALVDVIVREIAEIRRTTAGLTAEQLLSKIRRDEDALTIWHHLLNEVSTHERERLLLEILPDAYFAIPLIDDGFFGSLDHATRDRFATAFRITCDSLPEDSRRKISSRFVKILREEDGERVREYSKAFFRPSDLQFVPPQHRAIVMEHLLGRVGQQHDVGSLKQIDGIGSFLTSADVAKWLDPIARAMVSNRSNRDLKSRARQHVLNESARSSADVDEAMRKRLDAWLSIYDRSDSPDAASKAETLRELMSELPVDIPF